MAALTYTSTTFNATPKSVHVGLVTVSGQFVSHGSTSPQVNSLGDVIFLAKIPHGAVVVDFAVDHSTTEGTFGMKYGLASGTAAGGGASLSFYSPSLAKATAKTRWTGGTIALTAALAANATDPYRISCSDTDPNRYGIFAAKIATASASTTFIVNFSVTYRNDA